MLNNDLANFESFFNSDNFISDVTLSENLELSDEKRMSDPLFSSIGYPSKMYYKNIQKFIEAYTQEGGVVLDSFAGSGSTGIASILSNRKAVLVDNSPLATHTQYNILNYIDLDELEDTYKSLIHDLEPIIHDIYLTKMSNGELGYAENIMSSDTFECPSCSSEFFLYKNETRKRSEYACPKCLNKINLAVDKDKEFRRKRRYPVEVTIVPFSKGKREKREVTEDDIELWELQFTKYNETYGNLWSPQTKIVHNRAYPRKGGWPGFKIGSTVSDLFPDKNLLALKIMNNYIEEKIKNDDIKNFMKFIFLEILFRSSSRLYTTSGIKNVYQVPSLGKEQNILSVFNRKYKAVLKAKKLYQSKVGKASIDSNIRIINEDSKKLPFSNEVFDYAFIDPPYGGMVPYAELNLFYSSWLGKKEDLDEEIIIPMDYEKKEDYVKLWGEMIEEAFSEVYRTLKPGAYLTVAFHSTHNSIWNELRDAMQKRIGFQFVNTIINKRGTTFHTNHLNDTNPKSAFLTYRKPLIHSQQKYSDTLLTDVIDLTFFKNGKSFRDTQTEIIRLVNKFNLKEIPSEQKIHLWLDKHTTLQDGLYYNKK